MLKEIKKILDSLNSALFGLQNLITKTDNTAKEQASKEIKLDEGETKQKEINENLNIREGNVKEIESIVEFSNQAKDTMKKAKESTINADERQVALETGLKKLASDRVALEKEYQDKEALRKKEVEALKTERRKLEKDIVDFKIKKKISEELNK